MKHFQTDLLISPVETTIPLRHQIPIPDTWDLTALYASDQEWENDFKEYEQNYPLFEQFRGMLAQSPEKLLEILEFNKTLHRCFERLQEYASLKVAEDGADPNSLAKEQRLQALATRASEKASWFNPELLAISEERYQELISHPDLKTWQTYLHKIRRYRPHVLSFEAERLLALSEEPLNGQSHIFSQLTNVDMRFGTLTDEKGRVRELSQSSFSSFLVNRNPEVRQRAFHQFYHEFDDHKHSLAALLANAIKADNFHAQSRNYPSALEASLFHDDVPVSVYQNLIRSVRANLEPLFTYFDLRQHHLKLEKLHHYDTYVPLIDTIQTDTSFEQAIEMVLEALAPLGSEYTNVLANGLINRWVDRYETRGKRSGAFSSGSYGNPPYILMNYKRDVFSDVYTLAHEAGHSMHTWFSQKHQAFQDYGYTIFVAEVASTFNESLLTHHLLQKTDDSKMRAYLISRQIDDIRGTIYRQTMFAEFEKLIHEMQQAGEPLTLQSLRQTYRKLLNDYFGPRFVIDDELELECLRIPHFYSAFYVYKYATGLSAALSLSNKVLCEGSTAKQAYLNFLRSGGSLMPLETLKIAGVDMTEPAPIQNALQFFSQRVSELESLLTR